jgi:hypothetical protein
MVSGVRGLYSEIVLGGASRQGWWHVGDEEHSPGRILAGPFEDRADACWAAGTQGPGDVEELQPVYGFRRADGGLDRRESPQDRAWLAHLEEQLDRLPDGWDAGLSDDDPLLTLVVEVVAAMCDAGLPLHDNTRAGAVGGVCLTPEPVLGGIVVAWRQHDRMSVEQLHGPATDAALQQVMNGALAEVLLVQGFVVDAFDSGSGHVVRLDA